MPVEFLAFYLGELLLFRFAELRLLATSPRDLLGRLRRRYAEARQFIDNRIMLGSAPLKGVRATEFRSWTLNGVPGYVYDRLSCGGETGYAGLNCLERGCRPAHRRVDGLSNVSNSSGHKTASLSIYKGLSPATGRIMHCLEEIGHGGHEREVIEV